MDRIPADSRLLSTSAFFQLQEEERYRLARALMQGPGQILANTLLELEHSLSLLKTNPQAARAGLDSLREEVRGGLAQLKSLVAELQPPLLQEMGLGPSLQHYVTDFGVRNRIEVECEGCSSLRERLPSTIETAVFRIVQEALANVLAHSGATRVQVQVEHVANQLQVQIQDNGRGFQQESGTVRHRQLGLVAMREWAELVGGHLQLFSEAGKGLRVVVTVPYHAQTEDIVAGGRNENGRENSSGRESASARKRAN